MKTIITERNPYGLNRYGYLWEAVSKNLPKRHLDFGAYDGRVINQLAKTKVVAEAIGVDANEMVVAENNPLLEENVTLQHITTRPVVSLPFLDNTFDSISMLDVLEHVYDQDSLLKEIMRVLKPAGIFVVTVPGQHFFSFLDIANFKFCFPGLHKFFHTIRGKDDLYNERFVECKNGLFGDIEIEKMWHQHFTRTELIEVVEKSGCQIEDIDGAGFFDRLFFIPLLTLFRQNIFGDQTFLQKLRLRDMKHHHSAHLFATFRKL